MKLLFLDMDGVISVYNNRWCLSDEKIKHIKNIVEQTHCKIVITSSWKCGYDNVYNFVNNFIKLNPKSEKPSEMLIWLKLNIYDITDNNGPLRGDEIQRYLDSHDNIENYVIIDDDSDMLDSQLNNFIQTDTYEGITIREEKMIITFFNDGYVNNIRKNFINRFNYYKSLENN